MHNLGTLDRRNKTTTMQTIEGTNDIQRSNRRRSTIVETHMEGTNDIQRNNNNAAAAGLETGVAAGLETGVAAGLETGLETVNTTTAAATTTNTAKTMAMASIKNLQNEFGSMSKSTRGLLGFLAIFGVAMLGLNIFLTRSKPSSGGGGVAANLTPRPASYSVSTSSLFSEKPKSEDGLEVSYSCPEKGLFDPRTHELTKAYKDATESFGKNLKTYLNSFRKANFDKWDYTYTEYKRAQRDMVNKFFAPFLKDGDSMYESAMGVGMGSYMTLELLAESGIENITVYGNELVFESVAQANVIYTVEPPHHAKKGRICQGDSTKLDFVPANSFDLVFTGYVTPSQDPLNLGKANHMTNELDRFEKYNELCQEKDADWAHGVLNRLAQDIGEEWYARWVGEMIRIAKPGAPIVVEQVEEPFCKAPKKSYPGEGGVLKSWWEEAIGIYRWPVDPLTLDIRSGIPSKNIRYTVFMQKKYEEPW